MNWIRWTSQFARRCTPSLRIAVQSKGAPIVRDFRPCIVSLLVVLFPQVAMAQGKLWVGASVFSMDESQWKTAFSRLQPVRPPRLGVGGARGQWEASDTTVGGHSFESIFFTRNGKLQRIEHLWSAPPGDCHGGTIYDDVVGALTSQLGEPSASDSDIEDRLSERSTVWDVEDTYLIVYLQATDRQCSVRVVNKPKILKDASEL